MEEIRRVAVACGLPNFRYHSFPAVAFASIQATKPSATPLAITENTSVESAAASVLQHPEVVLSEVKVLATPLQPMMHPVTSTYSLLAEVADVVASPQAVAARTDPTTISGNRVQALSRPARRRPRSAARVALASISPT